MRYRSFEQAIKEQEQNEWVNPQLYVDLAEWKQRILKQEGIIMGSEIRVVADFETQQQVINIKCSDYQLENAELCREKLESKGIGFGQMSDEETDIVHGIMDSFNFDEIVSYTENKKYLKFFVQFCDDVRGIKRDSYYELYFFIGKEICVPIFLDRET